MTNPKIATLLGTVFTAAILFFSSTALTESEPANTNLDHHEKVFELRTYTTHDGKLEDLHTRFADHTMELFEKHDMENIGYWTPMDMGKYAYLHHST